MKAQNIIPNYRIADYVERILVIENNSFLQPFILPLFANGVPTLLFKSVKGKFKNSDSSFITLFGQTISPESLTLDADFTLIAYFLKPHCLISLFSISAIELTDKPIDLTLISSKKTISLQDQLLNCLTIDEMIKMLDNYILELINSSKGVSSAIIDVSEKISNCYSNESLYRVQKDLKISERTLQRIFKSNIGLSPNMYRRICQFNSAFTDLNMGNYNNLSDIAFNHGYSDQSHYIRSFREFTRLNPSEYLNFGEN
jgi:AraC-like DNA-binding protein